ncbi:ribonuclease III [Silvibacterium acidisoli]|uniref:ribonuclease III n=1 Tax=Acidobacteriaceae bacterium ZG23-2 TaxID=2883246 RepID=UPI00406C8E0A
MKKGEPQPKIRATKRSSALDQLEDVLGHRFSQPELLTQALTHRSLAYEQRLANPDTRAEELAHDNERLEFLGDAVVGFLVAEELCRLFPDLSEGELTRLRAELVSRKNLGSVATRLDLGSYMLLGRGEERSGGRKKHALLANCMEAVISALYLDAGIGPVRRFVLKEVVDPAANDLKVRMTGGNSIGDHKSALQEILQAEKRGHPEYAVKAESGPDHRKRFLVEVALITPENKPRALARGLGSTKKKAEQEAARRALLKLERVKSPSADSQE